MTKKLGLVMMKIRLTEREIREGYEGLIKIVSGKTTRRGEAVRRIFTSYSCQ